jgi:uncharacterized protein (UPF0332 family)
VIDQLLAKARQALATADWDLQAGDTDAAANRCYYAVFYAAWATFIAHGLDVPKTHSGMIGEFSRHFVKNGPFGRDLGTTLGKLESLRAYADYTLEPTPRSKVEISLEAARHFVNSVADHIVRIAPDDQAS